MEHPAATISIKYISMCRFVYIFTLNDCRQTSCDFSDLMLRLICNDYRVHSQFDFNTFIIAAVQDSASSVRTNLKTAMFQNVLKYLKTVVCFKALK